MPNPIFDACGDLIERLKAKGYLLSDAQYTMSYYDKPYFFVQYKDLAGNTIYKTFRGDKDESWLVHYAKAIEYIEKLPTIEEGKVQAFQAEVIRVLELGRSLNIDTGMISPIEELVKRLSTNIIEHKKDE